MPMPSYPVVCSSSGCKRPAAYKIAARWSDGITDELKTSSLACADCLPDLYAAAEVKRGACRLAAGECLHEPGIYELHRGGRDNALQRCAEIEAGIRKKTANRQSPQRQQGSER
jgi:hypothetical protein